MSWYRSARGLWCACFQAFQPDNGGGCPAYPCPENTELSRRFSGQLAAIGIDGLLEISSASLPLWHFDWIGEEGT